VFGIINPLGWLMQSIGMQGRSLRIALVIAPLLTAAYLLGLPYGAIGVASAFSAAMTLWLVPHILWSLHGTTIRPQELLLATSRPLLSAIVAAAFAFAMQLYFGQLQTPVCRLILGGSVMFVGYLCILLFVMGQKRFYLELLKALKTLPAAT
jgi:PST family polysaccharide transporter